MSLYTIWEHGVGAAVQKLPLTTAIESYNWGLSVAQNTDENWFHFAISTPTEINRSAVNVTQVFLRGKLIGEVDLNNLWVTRSGTTDAVTAFVPPQFAGIGGTANGEVPFDLAYPVTGLPGVGPLCVSANVKFNSSARVELYGAGLQLTRHNKTPRVVATGQTTPNDWKDRSPHPGSGYVFPGGCWVNVDTSAANLAQYGLNKNNPPIYHTILTGTVDHWAVIGANAIYFPTEKGFTVFIRHPTARISAASARKGGWYLKWTASAVD